VDCLLRGRLSMRFMFNKMPLFKCGHVQDVNGGNGRDQEIGAGLAGSMSHRA
jgi:hypothetical protein